MKAKCVYENLEFERGKDPKSTMDIGDRGDRKVKRLQLEADKLFQELAIEFNIPFHETYWRRSLDYHPDYVGFLGSYAITPTNMVAYKYSISVPNGDREYFLVEYGRSDMADVIGWKKAETLKDCKKILREWMKKNEKGILINESYNFERGQNPKKTLDIGHAHTRLIDKKIEKFLSIEHNRRNATGEFKVINGYYNYEKAIEIKYDSLFYEYNSDYIRRILKEAELWDYLEKPGFPASPSDSYSFGGNPAEIYYLTWNIKNEYSYLFNYDVYELHALFTDKGYEIRKKSEEANESYNFERGQDPKKTMQIGKYKDFYGKTEDQIASKIVSDLEFFLDPYFGQLSDLVEKKGYEDINAYQESIWDESEQEPLPEKQDPEIEAFINEIFKKAEDFIKEKYPIKKPYKDSRYLEPAASIASTIIGAYIDGAPHGTMLREISKEIDMSLVESLKFERGQDPNKSLGIGIEGKIRDILSDDEEIHRWIFAIDNTLGASMETYLPDKESKRMVRMWLENKFYIKNIWEFKVLERSDDVDREDPDYDMNDPAPIDYDIKALEAEGWIELYTEKYFGLVQSILYRENE